MTDNDKKYACDNDTELFGIGSGPSCGHKFYNTDKGKGSTISSTSEYDKFYSCDTKNYVQTKVNNKNVFIHKLNFVYKNVNIH